MHVPFMSVHLCVRAHPAPPRGGALCVFARESAPRRGAGAHVLHWYCVLSKPAVYNLNTRHAHSLPLPGAQTVSHHTRRRCRPRRAWKGNAFVPQSNSHRHRARRASGTPPWCTARSFRLAPLESRGRCEVRGAAQLVRHSVRLRQLLGNHLQLPDRSGLDGGVICHAFRCVLVSRQSGHVAVGV